MMLEDKVAVVYGAGGAIGGAVARAFASEGARVFVTGRHRAPVDAVAQAIGGDCEAATVDALDERAIEQHLGYVVDFAGRLDISFNAIGSTHPGIMGVPFTDEPVEQFISPITSYVTSYFLTARLLARHMIPQASGVIMTVTTLTRGPGCRSRAVRPVPGRQGVPHPQLSAGCHLTAPRGGAATVGDARVGGIGRSTSPERRRWG